MIELIAGAFLAGINAIVDYMLAHVINCLVPAFFIAGAMSALLPKEEIARYLGRKVPAYKAYPISIVAGLLLAVCSCTVLPLFAGIKKKGAGIGPALAFLYTAPATNLLAITFTGSVLGWNFALARIILSVSFAVIIGVIISSLFKDEDAETRKELGAQLALAKQKKSKTQQGFFMRSRLLILFILLTAILVIGIAKIPLDLKLALLACALLLLFLTLRACFSKDEIAAWLRETWFFGKMIFPLLLAGIFIAGFLGYLIPTNSLAGFVGSNTVFANLAAVLFGVFMYFPTLVEVPMAKMFTGLGMSSGPLLAYLLADPVISLPSILVMRRLIGTKRTLVYIFLIIVFCTISGLIYGSFVR